MQGLAVGFSLLREARKGLALYLPYFLSTPVRLLLLMFLHRLFRVFSSEVPRLSAAEVELIASIRLSPSVPLQGKELLIAQALQSKGLLKAAGSRRFILTEKAIVAFRAKRG